MLTGARSDSTAISCVITGHRTLVPSVGNGFRQAQRLSYDPLTDWRVWCRQRTWAISYEWCW